MERESQKIIRSLASGIRFDLSGSRIELKEVLFHLLSNLKYCCHVSTSVTVVWCTKHRHYVLLLSIHTHTTHTKIQPYLQRDMSADVMHIIYIQYLTPIKAFHYKLMRSWYQTQSIVMIKLSCNVLSKRVASTTGRYSPTTAVVWIRPE